MDTELQTALASAIRAASPEELPRLIGELSELHALCLARLTQPSIQPTSRADELLDVREAARRLGCSETYLYRNSAKLPFTRRLGRKLLFSELGLTTYIRRQK